MQTKWVIIADSNRARIFQTEGNLDELVELEDFLNPAARLAEHEWKNEPRGRFFGRGQREQADTGEPHATPIEQHEAAFSRQVMDYLEQGHHQQRYKELVFIAAPKFIGRLRKILPKQLKSCVSEELSKDIAGWSTLEIRTYLKAHLH